MEVFKITSLTIDGVSFDAPEGWTILDAAKFLGLDIPTLCYYEGLTPWGGCRMCLVEVNDHGRKKLVASCTSPVTEGLVVSTASDAVVKARKLSLELLISECPTSKTLQDMASRMGLKEVRFTPKWKDCILCGLCVRVCEEQMMAGAIHFVNRGKDLKVSTYFDRYSEECRKCGACMKICPVVTSRCEGPNANDVLCNGCLNELQPTCLAEYDHFDCWMGLKGECGTCVQNLKSLNIELKK